MLDDPLRLRGLFVPTALAREAFGQEVPPNVARAAARHWIDRGWVRESEEVLGCFEVVDRAAIEQNVVEVRVADAVWRLGGKP
jgi:hypothetical protein